MFPSVTRYAHYGFDGQQFPQTLTAPGSTNTKGAWLELAAATTFDAHGVILQVRASTTASRTYLVDMGVGSSGNEVVKIPNLFTTHAGQSHTAYYHFPGLFIPAGTRLSGRYQSASTTSPICRLSISIYQSAFPLPLYHRVRAWGAATSDSGGTLVTAGASFVEGSWTQLVASTDIDAHYVVVAASHGNGDYTLTNDATATDIGIGSGGNEKAVLTNLSQTAGNNIWFPMSFGPFWWDIPSGTRIAARALSSISSPDPRDVIVYGVG